MPRNLCPAPVLAKGAQYVEDWSEEYLVGLLESGSAAGIHIYGWFWGLWGNPVLHSGYPWVFGWEKMMAEGLDRFRNKTAKIRARANKLGAYLAQELHPGTGAICCPRFRAALARHGLRQVPVRLGGSEPLLGRRELDPTVHQSFRRAPGGRRVMPKTSSTWTALPR